MNTIPRKIVLPIVSAVWVVAVLVALYTLVMLPWFAFYYHDYQHPGVGWNFLESPKLFISCTPLEHFFSWVSSVMGGGCCILSKQAQSVWLGMFLCLLPWRLPGLFGYCL